MLFYAVVSLGDVSSELLLFEKESHPPVNLDHYDKSVIVDEFSGECAEAPSQSANRADADPVSTNSDDDCFIVGEEYCMTVPVPATSPRPIDVGRGAIIGSSGKYIIIVS